MKYIIFIIMLFLIGCSNSDSENRKIVNRKIVTDVNKTIIKKNLTIKIDDLNFEVVNKKLIPKFHKKAILLFANNNALSQEQISYLNKLKISYHKVENEKLKEYFKITNFPTIVVIDGNKTKIYDNILPYEILKTELGE